ncbi:MAG: potassium-transporting ATPase subunit KdpC [Pseudomonadota bacterium]|jgi:K+-transporting ATPase ATPase C chain
MIELKTLLRPALVSFALLTVITGLLYPMAVTGVAQILLPEQANGSLIEQNGQVIGSRLIGQAFDDPTYFWGRPSATATLPYNAQASGGSNLGPSNPALVKAVEERIQALRAANPEATGPVPMDLVTASASGLDPDISTEAALWQAPRVAKARGLPLEEVVDLVRAQTRGPTLGLLGVPRTNVLELNLALDRLVRERDRALR